MAWENADRFSRVAGQHQYRRLHTLVNPTPRWPLQEQANDQPGAVTIDDCRWKTQNVVACSVNDFTGGHVPKAAICVRFRGAAASTALFSNYGTYPDWSPFKADMVENNITFKQNNVWRDNTYIGEWHFMAKEAGQDGELGYLARPSRTAKTRRVPSDEESERSVGTCRTSQGRHPDGPRSIG